MSIIENLIIPIDYEWKNDWIKIENVFNKIEELNKIFKSLNVNIAMELSQKILILNLKKYAYSLQHIIIDKYSN